MLGTALAESGLRALRQHPGPALGLWQMEPVTHDDIWHSFLPHRVRLIQTLSVWGPTPEGAPDMAWNLRYACAMARIEYMRVADVIPSGTTNQAAYWVRFYNRGCAATEKHYIQAWTDAGFHVV